MHAEPKDVARRCYFRMHAHGAMPLLTLLLARQHMQLLVREHQHGICGSVDKRHGALLGDCTQGEQLQGGAVHTAQSVFRDR